MAVAGWGVTLWLGEPVATSGPGPAVPPASGAEPGPQPEFDCKEAVARAAERSRARTADPSAPTDTSAPTAPAPTDTSAPTAPAPTDTSAPTAPAPTDASAPTGLPTHRAPVAEGGQSVLSVVACDYSVAGD
ncbi:hypothetical protein OG912_11210 [Streptomyces sp. NBC_00464]|uniref:hypothetical protein n=1 Tax=Streptomyces sp. NBC_00464 TaxID=2975751 RepID=UPI002E17479D